MIFLFLFSTNYECPYCCAIVTQNDVLRIFPSEDEETEELAAKCTYKVYIFYFLSMLFIFNDKTLLLKFPVNAAKADHVDKEISQLKSKLDEYMVKHEEEQLAHESLK